VYLIKHKEKQCIFPHSAVSVLPIGLSLTFIFIINKRLRPTRYAKSHKTTVKYVYSKLGRKEKFR
jgi:hypothetical protein